MNPTLLSTRNLCAVVAFAVPCFGPAVAMADGPVSWHAEISTSELAAERAQGVVQQEVAETAAIGGGSISIDGLEATNLIDGGAFAGSSGLVNVLQNNGNGAIVSNTMNVVITVHPGPPGS